MTKNIISKDRRETILAKLTLDRHDLMELEGCGTTTAGKILRTLKYIYHGEIKGRPHVTTTKSYQAYCGANQNGEPNDPRLRI